MGQQQSSSSTPSRTIKIFISYAHEDSELRDDLVKHLSGMKQQGLIEDWNAYDISPGSNWERAIDIQMRSSHIILLLVSADFLRSEYSSSGEMRKAMKRHHAGEVYVIPIILRPVDWEGLIFGKLQPLPLGAKAVTLWQNRDDAFLNIARGIKKVVNELTTKFLVESPTSVDTQGVDPHKLPLVWNVPYRRNPFFTGREDILANLHKSFRAQGSVEARAQAISGLGGVGKSQIAIEYCYRYALDYTAVLWVKADLYENLVADFVQVANLLVLPERDASDQHTVIAAVKRWLQQNRQWLLVLDNVEDVTMLDEFIPPVYRGHILITTRSHAVGELARATEIMQMQPQEGALLLLRRAKLIATDTNPRTNVTTDSMNAQEISVLVDGLPLALDQAGAYIEETKSSLPDYLNTYRERQIALLKRRGKFIANHPLSVSATFQLALEKIEHTNTNALELLKLVAFLHPETIAQEIFTTEDADLQPPLQSLVEDTFELNEAIEELLKFSLVRRNAETRVFGIHRLVQAVIKDMLNNDERRQQVERAVRSIAYLFPGADFENWALCKRYLPQALVCAEHIEQWKIETGESAQLLSHVGLYLLEHAFYKESEVHLQHSLTIRERIFGPDDPETARSLNDLGGLYRIRGKYEEAEPLSLRALAIREKVLGAEHLDTAESLNYVGLLYNVQGKYEQVESLYVRALAIREKALGMEHRKTAQSMNNLASLYQRQGRYSEAELLYKRALATREQMFGEEHPDIANSLNTLASLYRDQGKYAEAELLYKRALAIREHVLGNEHPNTARSMNGLALLYQTQGRYAEAEPLYKRALEIEEQVLGAEHLGTARSLNSLAQYYRTQGKYEEAEPLYQRALSIREHTLGIEHPDTAQSLNNLAGLYRRQKKYEEAERLAQRALAIREKILGAEHPETAQNLNDLARLYQKQEKYEEAERLAQRALEIREKVLGAEHPNTAQNMITLAEVYFAQKKYEEAERLAQRALTVQEKILGVEHPDTVQSLNILAEMYLAQEKYEETEDIYQRIVAIYQQTLQSDNPKRVKLLNNYANLLFIMKRDEEANAIKKSIHST